MGGDLHRIQTALDLITKRTTETRLIKLIIRLDVYRKSFNLLKNKDNGPHLKTKFIICFLLLVKFNYGRKEVWNIRDKYTQKSKKKNKTKKLVSYFDVFPPNISVIFVPS